MPLLYAQAMTASEILDEIKRLPPAEQAEVVRLVGDLAVPMTGEELGGLATKLVAEHDPEKAKALKDQIIAGFYGEKNA
jgi:hypothetical protein